MLYENVRNQWVLQRTKVTKVKQGHFIEQFWNTCFTQYKLHDKAVVMMYIWCWCRKKPKHQGARKKARHRPTHIKTFYIWQRSYCRIARRVERKKIFHCILLGPQVGLRNKIQIHKRKTNMFINVYILYVCGRNSGTSN